MLQLHICGGQHSPAEGLLLSEQLVRTGGLEAECVARRTGAVRN